MKRKLTVSSSSGMILVSTGMNVMYAGKHAIQSIGKRIRKVVGQSQVMMTLQENVICVIRSSQSNPLKFVLTQGKEDALV